MPGAHSPGTHRPFLELTAQPWPVWRALTVCPSSDHLQSTINPFLLWPKTQSSALSPCSPPCSLLWRLFGDLPQQCPSKASHTPFPEPLPRRRGVLTLKDLFCSCKGGNTVFPNTHSLLGVSLPGHAKSSASQPSCIIICQLQWQLFNVPFGRNIKTLQADRVTIQPTKPVQLWLCIVQLPQ